MKTSIYIILALTACLKTQAQQIFAPVGATWHYSSASQGTAPPDAAFWLYKSEKDTTLSNISCKKISRTLFNKLGDTSININPINIYTYTSGDTVMYYNTFMNKFTPLYIFNVQQGDTVTLYKPHNPIFGIDTTFRVVIDSINFLQVNNLSLKRIYTSPLDEFTYNSYYVERLGSIDVMLPEYFIGILERDGPLRCYSDADIAINFTLNACNYQDIVNINEIKKNNSVEIYPNPASKFITIKSSDYGILNTTLYNLQGQQIEYLPFVTNEKNIQLDMGNLSAGVYMLLIQFSNGQYQIQQVVRE